MKGIASIARIAGLEERIADFAANCIHVCDLLPRGRAGASNFKDQLARSATSVAANYAEATVPSSQRDFSGRLTIALKELAESRMHLSVIARLGYRRNLTKEVMAALIAEADALARILKSAFTVKRGSRVKKQQDDAGDGALSSADTIADMLRRTAVKPKKLAGRKKKSATRPSARRKTKTPLPDADDGRQIDREALEWLASMPERLPPALPCVSSPLLLDVSPDGSGAQTSPGLD